MAIRIDGKATAARVRASARERALALRAGGIRPHLAVILAGEDPASEVYVRNKARACAEAEILSTVVRLPQDVTQDALETEIRRLNADPAVHGILVQLPLPAGLDEARALALIDPAKDVDGFHDVNAGRLWKGLPGFVPCTPLGVMELLRAYGIDPAGRRAVVVGRSSIVGKPMAALLLAANATVTVCHSKTRDLAAVTREADILVAAVGKPRMITADMIKPGAAVVDVGINRVDGKLVGDVDAAAEDVAGWLTPVPGGVGPMTIAMLLMNTLQAAEGAWRS